MKFETAVYVIITGPEKVSTIQGGEKMSDSARSDSQIVFSVPEGTVRIEKRRCYSENGECTAEIPKKVTSLFLPDSVTVIGEDAFDGCSFLTAVDLPGSVRKIGDGAFSGCSSLTSVTIPRGVTVIGEDAFRDCSALVSVEIPDTVTEIGLLAFSGCSSLVSADIPNSVRIIGVMAFSGCTSLVSVKIPDSVALISICGVFLKCSSLREIKVSPGNRFFHDIDGVLYEGTKLRIYPPGKDLETYSIPDSATEIDNDAFQDCTKLTAVEIPGSVRKIGEDVTFHLRR